MQTTNTIPFSSVIVSDRIRKTYNKVEELADNIADHGLIQPIVLRRDDVTDAYYLVAGGRRHAALTLLGTETLFHAATSDPDRPGFILVGEESTVLSNLLTEINENLNREDVDWRDNMVGIVRAYRLAQAQEHEKGRDLAMRTFGAMLGVPSQDVRAACAVHDAVVANPEKFKDVFSIRGAYALILKENARAAEKMLDEKVRAVGIQVEPQQEENSNVATVTVEEVDVRPVLVPTSERFFLGNSITYLESLTSPTFDHIICDPDYAIDKDRLAAKSWSPDTSSDGVIQSSVEDSLNDLYRFIRAAFCATSDGAFLIFWYDLDHHEKLQRVATAVGWAVQRWPLIWHKTDFRGNAAPGQNFCKNMEYAMVCRKPGATLASTQLSSVFSLPGDAASKTFNHPFAKPEALWTKLFAAVTVKGQSVFDPFMGSGSSCVAALRYGLTPYGMELNPDHYYNALNNIRTAYSTLIPNATFV